MAKKWENSLNNRKNYEQPKSSEIVWFLTRKSQYTDLVADTLNSSPEVSLFENEYNIWLWKRITIERDGLKIWDESIAIWNKYNDNDNNNDDCEVFVKFNWRDITTWYMLNEPWNITFTVRNKKNWKETTKSIKINKESSTEIFEPEINLSHEENLIIEWNELKMWDKVIASWGENYKTIIHFIPNFWEDYYIRDKYSRYIDPTFEKNPLNEEWIIKISTGRKNNDSIRVEAWSNSKETIKVNVINAPKINIEKKWINIPYWERKFFIEWNELKIWNQVIASLDENDWIDWIDIGYQEYWEWYFKTFNFSDLNKKNKEKRIRDYEISKGWFLKISLKNKNWLKTTRLVQCSVEWDVDGYYDTSDEEWIDDSASVNSGEDNQFEIIRFNPEIKE